MERSTEGELKEDSLASGTLQSKSPPIGVCFLKLASLTIFAMKKPCLLTRADPIYVARDKNDHVLFLAPNATMIIIIWGGKSVNHLI